MSRILRFLLGVLLLAGLAPAVPVAAQTSDVFPWPQECTVIDHGTSDGSQIAVCIPQGWSGGDVVIFAHGYVNPTDPSIKIPTDQLWLPDHTNTLPGLVISLGYVFATTSYPNSGLVVEGNTNTGVQAVLQLVDYLKTPGNLPEKPNHIYLTGASEGGLVTTLAIEKHPHVFAGGLATCGPIGDFNYQTSYLGDFRMVFDYLFKGSQGILLADYGFGNPWIPEDMVTDSYFNNFLIPATAVAMADPVKTAQLFNVTHVAYDPAKPDTMLASALQVFSYNLFATDDGITRLGGNPYNNKNPYRVYLGSKNDIMLNLQVKRYAASPTALAKIQALLQTSGRLQDPLVTMHTLLDPVVPYIHETFYTAKVLQNGRFGLRTNIPIAAYGHCNFTAAQVLVGFGVMVLKASARGFTMETIQAALPDPQAQQEYQTLMDQVMGSQTPKIYLPMIQQ